MLILIKAIQVFLRKTIHLLSVKPIQSFLDESHPLIITALGRTWWGFLALQDYWHRFCWLIAFPWLVFQLNPLGHSPSGLRVYFLVDVVGDRSAEPPFNLSQLTGRSKSLTEGCYKSRLKTFILWLFWVCGRRGAWLLRSEPKSARSTNRRCQRVAGQRFSFFPPVCFWGRFRKELNEGNDK